MDSLLPDCGSRLVLARPRGRWTARALVATALLALSTPAVARAETAVFTPFALLGIPADEGDKVQRWLRAAAQTVPETRWLSPERLADKLKGKDAAACLAQAKCVGSLARAAGAQVAVAGEIGSLGGGYMIYLRLVSDTGKRLRTANGVLDPQKPNLRAAARGLMFQLLRPDQHAGTLVVKVDVPNAWIYLDGRRVARSPAGPITPVSVGTHALRVTHESYRDFVRFVNVGFEQAVEVDVGLSRFPVRAEEMRLLDGEGVKPLTSAELPWYRRWWAVTAFGAVLLAGATTTMAILTRGSVPRDSEAVVRP